MTENKKSLRDRFREMEIGETTEVCIGCYGYTTVRTYASELGFMLGRRYSVHLDRESRNYQITRTF